MKKIAYILFLMLPMFFVSQIKSPVTNCIPLPNSIVAGQGEFIVSGQTKFVIANPALKSDCDGLINHLKTYYAISLQILNAIPSSGNYILLNELPSKGTENETYEMIIASDKITINAAKNSAGFFYALQTLSQLLPLPNDVKKETSENKVSLACCKIIDEPRFKWRGMHLDVSRHFFNAAFIKKYIDLLALFKMNTFHWHLTDDQGWRIEIKKYPLLTQKGAWRKGSMIGAYTSHTFDSVPYGGFYTQEQIKDIVAYASLKHITIVPEIEMPGHSVAAITSYPWLSCRGQKIDTEKAWGVFEDVFCTKDSTFEFLQDVLAEVADLFPGKYIHIGGDECPKTRWKECKTCQARMAREHLNNENELQSYFIKRIAAYLKTKNKSIIGWDEIMEGGLAEDATVMSWRGTEGGVEAAKLRHNAVMTPGSHCYFDHYQAPAKDEPIAIGGYTPLEKVYAFEPIPKELSAEESKYIIGAQANVWTEYITTEKHVEYMVLPRMAAMAEVLWTRKENKNESDFLRRIQAQFLLFDMLHYNYAKALYNVNFKIDRNETTKKLELELLANKELGLIYYTLDGTMPTKNSLQYRKPLKIDSSVLVSAAMFINKSQFQKMTQQAIDMSLATAKTISFVTAPSKYYNSGGGFTLINGVKATLPRKNNEWLGWSGFDMAATIDLGSEKEISEIEADFLKEELSWIYLPKEVVFLISKNGETFQNLGTLNDLLVEDNKSEVVLGFKKQKARYVKIIAKNAGKIASGMPGAGEDSWLFCDEILVR